MAAVEQAAARVADMSAAAAIDPITADAMAVHDALRDVRAAATAGNATATAAGTIISLSSSLRPELINPPPGSLSSGC